MLSHQKESPLFFSFSAFFVTDPSPSLRQESWGWCKRHTIPGGISPSQLIRMEGVATKSFHRISTFKNEVCSIFKKCSLQCNNIVWVISWLWCSQQCVSQAIKCLCLWSCSFTQIQRDHARRISLHPYNLLLLLICSVSSKKDNWRSI